MKKATLVILGLAIANQATPACASNLQLLRTSSINALWLGASAVTIPVDIVEGVIKGAKAGFRAESKNWVTKGARTLTMSTMGAAELGILGPMLLYDQRGMTFYDDDSGYFPKDTWANSLSLWRFLPGNKVKLTRWRPPLDADCGPDKR